MFIILTTISITSQASDQLQVQRKLRGLDFLNQVETLISMQATKIVDLTNNCDDLRNKNQQLKAAHASLQNKNAELTSVLSNRESVIDSQNKLITILQAELYKKTS